MNTSVAQPSPRQLIADLARTEDALRALVPGSRAAATDRRRRLEARQEEIIRALRAAA